MITWLAASALAQDVVSGGDVPELNAQNFRPTVDGARTLWVDDAARAPEGPVGRLLFHYTDDPLVYVTGDTEIGLVRSVTQADLVGGWAFGPARLGLVVPLYLFASGDPGDATGLGDLGFDGKLSLLGKDAPLDLALQGRLTAPTATVDLPLGSPGLGWEVSAIASKQAGPVLLAANLGTTGVPRSDLENVTFDDSFTARGALGYDLVENVGVAAELTTHLSYTSFSTKGSDPSEVLFSGWGRPGGDLLVRAGVGTGLSAGIGSPDFRAIVGVSYAPTGEAAPTPKVAGDTDADGLADDIDACVTDPEDKDAWQDEDGCPDPDNDSDGLADDADGCRNEPEDKDTWQDEDGCPDLTSQLRIAIVDDAGQRVDLAKAVVRAEDGRTWPVSNGQGELEVGPGTYVIEARAGTYDPNQVQVLVPDGPPVSATVVLAKQKNAMVVVTRDRIDLKDKVYFETASAKIKPESFGLLDQAIQILRDYQEIELLRIEGHTDVRGSDSYNLQLSKDRAASVRQYLVDHGIDPNRVTSEGFGETRPLDPANNEAAWSKNRRVDFFIERWNDGARGPATP